MRAVDRLTRGRAGVSPRVARARDSFGQGDCSAVRVTRPTLTGKARLLPGPVRVVRLDRGLGTKSLQEKTRSVGVKRERTLVHVNIIIPP
jgi:hypothetical protein